MDTEHKLHKCNYYDCAICLGGLAVCEVCKQAEATLQSSCPGKPKQDAGLKFHPLDSPKFREWLEDEGLAPYAEFGLYDSKWGELYEQFLDEETAV